MPTIYRYLGMIFKFWSNEHNPVHVHVEYQDTSCTVYLHGTHGRIIVDVKNASSGKRMDEKTLREVRKFAEKYKEKIMSKWTDYHVYGKKLKPEIITRRVH